MVKLLCKTITTAAYGNNTFCLKVEEIPYINYVCVYTYRMVFNYLKIDEYAKDRMRGILSKSSEHCKLIILAKRMFLRGSKFF